MTFEAQRPTGENLECGIQGFNSAGLKERRNRMFSRTTQGSGTPKRGDTHLVCSLRRWCPQTTGYWHLLGNRTYTLCDTRGPRLHPVGSQRGRVSEKSGSKVTMVSTTEKACVQKPCSSLPLSTAAFTVQQHN